MIIKLVVGFFCCALVLAEKYSDKYDKINIDEILANKRLFKAYVDCMMDRGKCTPAGKGLRDHIGDALETGCEKCTEMQERESTKIIDFLIKNERGYWKELCSKYDPDGVWRKKYEERAKEKGIIIPEE